MPKIDQKKLLAKGPNLDMYLNGKKKRYTTYGLGASLYALHQRAYRIHVLDDRIMPKFLLCYMKMDFYD